MIETIQIGDPVLRETAQAVKVINDQHIQQIITDLISTMRENNLVGIAAPQIGESVRIFVSEIRETRFRKKGTDELRIYINPEITTVSHETEIGWEGCGSVINSGLFAKVERAKQINVKFTDEMGVSREIKASGLLARVIQHENDHLNGVMFTDLCDPMTMVSREYYINNIANR